MKLALMECGRKLGTYLRKRDQMKRQEARRDVFQRYIGEISKAVSEINGSDQKKLYEVLLAQARKRTAAADLELDEEGKAKKGDPVDDLKNDDSVLIVESRATQAIVPPSLEEAGDSGPKPDLEKLSTTRKAKKKKPAKEDPLFD
jgi:DNA topoisomerase-6 subunit B